MALPVRPTGSSGELAPSWLLRLSQLVPPAQGLLRLRYLVPHSASLSSRANHESRPLGAPHCGKLTLGAGLQDQRNSDTQQDHGNDDRTKNTRSYIAPAPCPLASAFVITVMTLGINIAPSTVSTMPTTNFGLLRCDFPCEGTGDWCCLIVTPFAMSQRRYHPAHHQPWRTLWTSS